MLHGHPHPGRRAARSPAPIVMGGASGAVQEETLLSVSLVRELAATRAIDAISAC